MIHLFTDTGKHKLKDVNLLILTSSFPQKPESYEGIFILELVNKLNFTQFQPFVLTPHFYNAPFFESWIPGKIFRFPYFFPSRFERLAYGSGMAYNIRNNPAILANLPFFILSELIFTLYFIKKYKILLIHTHWVIPQGMIGALVYCLTRLPHITTVHGSDLNILKKYPVLHSIGRFITRNSSIITVNSNYMKQQLLAVSPDCEQKIQIIPMGINPDRFIINSYTDMKRHHGTKYLILSVGRLIDWKGTKFLIKAMPLVLDKYPDSKLIIAGTGPELEFLKNEARDLGLQNRIEFMGVVPSSDLLSYYKSADVFVLPSIHHKGKTEGLGVVLLEAMAANCPVIGSNVGGIPDIITDGENGFLVPEKDSIALAEKIAILLSDNTLSDKFRKAGCETVLKSYSWEIISRKFYGVYCTALEKDGKKDLECDEISWSD